MISAIDSDSLICALAVFVLLILSVALPDSATVNAVAPDVDAESVALSVSVVAAVVL
jgi:hypothetical protein